MDTGDRLDPEEQADPEIHLPAIAGLRAQLAAAYPRLPRMLESVEKFLTAIQTIKKLDDHRQLANDRIHDVGIDVLVLRREVDSNNSFIASHRDALERLDLDALTTRLTNLETKLSNLPPAQLRRASRVGGRSLQDVLKEFQVCLFSLKIVECHPYVNLSLLRILLMP